MAKYQLIKIDGTLISEYNSIEEVNSLLESSEGVNHYWFDTTLIEDLSEQLKDSPSELDSVVIIKLVDEVSE